jgi:hypothetical protein
MIIPKPKYIGKNVVDKMYMYSARYVSFLKNKNIVYIETVFCIVDIHWRICSGVECSTCLLPSCAGHPRALEQGSSCQVKLPVYLSTCLLPLCWSPQSIGARFLVPGKATCLPVYLSAAQLCWSPQSIGARFLMPGKATCPPVCYPAVLVTPEHWSKVPHTR